MLQTLQSYGVRRWFGAAVLGLFALVSRVDAASAECRLKDREAGQAVAEGFRQIPKGLLTVFPQGGQGMTRMVSQMASNGAEALSAVNSVIAVATDAQRKAIGEGFAVAANACQSQDARIVQRINDAVKGSGNATLQRAFLMAHDDGSDMNAVADHPRPQAEPLVMDMRVPGVQAKERISDPFGSFESWH